MLHKHMLHKKVWSILLAALVVAGLAGCGAGSQTSGDDPSAQLVSISVTPADPTFAINTSTQFTATGIYSNNTTKDLTQAVTWSSSDETVATVDGSGLVSGKGIGSATIDAAYATADAAAGGIHGKGNVNVSGAKPVSIAITPVNPGIAKGTNQQFTATGTFSDNTTQDLTAQVTWSSSNTGVASISNAAGSQGYAISLAAGSTTITATLKNITVSVVLTITPATLVSIGLTPANPGVAIGTTRQFTATGTFSDNTTQDLTASASWSSSNTGVATISNAAGSNGLSKAVAAGTTTITAAAGSISGSTTLTVTPATLVSISITPVNPSIAKGTTQQFIATGTYSDSTTQNLTASAAWSSSNTGAASISNAVGSKGLATAVAAGTTTITAASGSVSGTATLTITPATLVSIAITPNNPSIAKGTTQQFTATGTYSDSTTQNLTATATWNSSNTGVATISNAVGSKGLATPIAAGTTAITAVSGSVSGTATLTITPATLVSIAVTPTNPSIAKGTTQQFTATGTYSDSSTQNLTAAATWSSSNTGVASISNAVGSKGLATAVASGTATITAASGSASGTAILTVIASSQVTLSWNAPTTYTDGTYLDPATALSKYRIHYGTSSGTYTQTVDVINPGTTTITYALSLVPGTTYYFAVTAVDILGLESGDSTEAYKTL